MQAVADITWDATNKRLSEFKRAFLDAPTNEAKVEILAKANKFFESYVVDGVAQPWYDGPGTMVRGV